MINHIANTVFNFVVVDFIFVVMFQLVRYLSRLNTKDVRERSSVVPPRVNFDNVLLTSFVFEFQSLCILSWNITNQ